jgi:hypothetical protein
MLKQVLFVVMLGVFLFMMLRIIKEESDDGWSKRDKH